MRLELVEPAIIELATRRSAGSGIHDRAAVWREHDGDTVDDDEVLSLRDVERKARSRQRWLTKRLEPADTRERRERDDRDAGTKAAQARRARSRRRDRRRLLGDASGRRRKRVPRQRGRELLRGREPVRRQLLERAEHRTVDVRRNRL